RLVPSQREPRPDGEPPRANRKAKPAGLRFDNGLAGFTPDGREYVVRVSAEAIGAASGGHAALSIRHRLPPMPWINVIANPSFGFLVSESGAGYTWCGHSQANRLTPWNNHPVSDSPSEIIYIRDEATGEFWTCPAMLVPARSPEPPARVRPVGDYNVRHGQGYTVFEQEHRGLWQEL